MALIKKIKILILSLSLTLCFLFLNPVYSLSSESSHKAATTPTVVNYARTLLLSIVDTNFRGSWVIDPENWDNVAKSTQKIQKTKKKKKKKKNPGRVKKKRKNLDLRNFQRKRDLSRAS